MLTQAPLTVLIVDDEPLARARLRALLDCCKDPHAQVLAEAGTASAAQAWLREHGCDLAFLDVQMPGPDGLVLADSLRHHPRPPMVVFVTAHARHAVDAFELDAIDYLTKPVRLERLQAALARAAQRKQEREAALAVQPQGGPDDDVIPINDRGRLLRLPVHEVLYLKAELKYLTVRTATQRYVMDGALNDWEQRLGSRFLRIHRNALVAKAAVRELDRHAPTDAPEAPDPTDAHAAADETPGEAWAVRVAQVGEWLAVSRRQLASVREALKAQGG